MRNNPHGPSDRLAAKMLEGIDVTTARTTGSLVVTNPGPMRTTAEYEAWLAGQHDPVRLRAEALERMRINVGLIAENAELKRRVQRLEEGGR
jgi:hypothetical protein